MRRYNTRKEDAVFLARRSAEANRDWQVGEAVRSFIRGFGLPDTTIVRFEGDIAILADGSEGHRSHLRHPGGPDR